ncbi:MAG: hypothetical protein P1U65_03305 [Minwuia sp.]|nr:hypothetical protein [Minwuia sp.]
MTAPAPHDSGALWRGTFNQWHVGLAGHVNIQHTAQAIDDARQAFVLQAGTDPVAARASGTGFGGRRLWVEFRQELVPGDTGYITGVPQAAVDGRKVLHGQLTRSHDAVVATRFETSIDRIDLATGTFGDPLGMDMHPAVPQSETSPPLRAIPQPERPPGLDPAMQQSWLGTVERRDADASGRMTTRALFDVATRGIWSTQILAGITREKLSAEAIGAGVTAMQVEQLLVPAAGDLLSAHTGVLGLGQRSCRFRHLVRDVALQQDVAVIDYVLAFFDRRTGKPAPLTATYRQAVNHLLIAEGA